MPQPNDDPRTYLAAERTLLAWIRTGLGLMGVGFAVARFGLFLREMRPGQLAASNHSSGHSVAAPGSTLYTSYLPYPRMFAHLAPKWK